jgi:hypothetical protein
VSKRAQMEILGLAIVVVLLTLVALISLKFFTNKQPSTIRKEFVDSELAGSFLSTLMKTSAGCKKTNFAELLQDCAGGLHSVKCDSPNFQDSCDFARAKITDILQSSLGTQNEYYDFTAKTSFADIMKNINNYPQDFHPKTIESKQFLLPLNPGTLVVKLDIASK